MSLCIEGCQIRTIGSRFLFTLTSGSGSTGGGCGGIICLDYPMLIYGGPWKSGGTTVLSYSGTGSGLWSRNATIDSRTV